MAKSKKTKKDPHAKREAQKYEHPIASRELILEFIQNHQGPVTFTKLCKLLNLTSDRDQTSLERRVRAMERDGQLVRNRRGAFLPVGKADLIRGRIIGHPDGFGFLNPDEGADGDIFLSPKQMRCVLHGDRAVVQVIQTRRDGRQEGMLVEVLERHNQQVVGRFHEENDMTIVVPDNKRIHQDIFIPGKHRNQAKHGQIVTATIIEQPSKHTQPVGKITEILGEHMSPGMEIDIAIRAHALPYEFSDEVLAQAASFSEESITTELKDRKDLRNLPFVTIDGEDAKDFDDAVYCTPSATGWKLYVAIADVSFYVQPKTKLDDEAQWRGTSVYFPGNVIPMLPEHLSNGLCSLNPHIPRLAMVCEMSISPKGTLRGYKFYQAVIQSHARLTYTEVAHAIIDRKETARNNLGELCGPLDDLNVLFHALTKHRIQRGALEFHTTETKIEFGEDQKIKRIYPFERNDAHRIIEECMIIANVATAKYLTKHKFPGLYRIHEGPTPTKLKDLRELLKSLGMQLGGGEKPEPKHYTALLETISQRPEDHWIETVLLRSLTQAVYSPDNIGHFGLSHEFYAHFTSPIRRYPDLVVHRALRHIISKQKPDSFTYTSNDLALLGQHCSMAERRADEATRDATTWLKCEYMQDKLGETFAGTITGVTSFGLFVELTDIYVEGLVHISTLEDDYYHYDATKFRLQGEQSGKTYRLGDKVKATVMKIDLDEKKMDFILADTQPKRKKIKKPRRKQHK